MVDRKTPNPKIKNSCHHHQKGWKRYSPADKILKGQQIYAWHCNICPAKYNKVVTGSKKEWIRVS